MNLLSLYLSSLLLLQFFLECWLSCSFYFPRLTWLDLTWSERTLIPDQTFFTKVETYLRSFLHRYCSNNEKRGMDVSCAGFPFWIFSMAAISTYSMTWWWAIGIQMLPPNFAAPFDLTFVEDSTVLLMIRPPSYSISRTTQSSWNKILRLLWEGSTWYGLRLRYVSEAG